MVATNPHFQPPKNPHRKLRQYYYRNDDCPAADSELAECWCWYDEGTGSLADQPEQIKQWRVKPEDAPSLEAELHKVAKRFMTKRQQGYFMGAVRQLLLDVEQASSEKLPIAPVPLGKVVSKYGDPDMFAERELQIDEARLQALPIGTLVVAWTPKETS